MRSRRISMVLVVGALLAVALPVGARSASAAAGDPEGNLDSVVPSPGGLRVIGWAIDPNAGGTGIPPVEVHVYINGAFALQIPASEVDVARPDLLSSPQYAQYGQYHGFSEIISRSPGTYNVCAYAINVGQGSSNPQLGSCKPITVSNNPFGNFETNGGSAVYRVPGGIRVKGWAIDPDTSSSMSVRPLVNGNPVGTNVPADRSRPDVAAAFPDYGADHGFDFAVPYTTAGTIDLCMRGVNKSGTPGVAQQLGTPPQNCANGFVVSNTPFGNTETATTTLSGTTTVTGWAIDPDTASPIQVHIYAGVGTGAQAVYLGSTPANLPRSDVDAAHPGYGPNHGFSFTTTAALPKDPLTGGNAVLLCGYGINAASTPGGNAKLGLCDGVKGPGPMRTASTITIGDPDTVYDGGEWEYTFGTNDQRVLPSGPSIEKPECGGETISASVPVLRTPALAAGSSLGEVNCVSYDALPGGAVKNGIALGADQYKYDIWAPSVVYYNGKWRMYFGFVKTLGPDGAPGQKCIARSHSDFIHGPYIVDGEWTCPGDGDHWNIDPSAFIDPVDGKLYVAYRDDLRQPGEKSLVIMSTNSDGSADLSPGRNRLVVDSNDVEWDSEPVGENVENPEPFRGPDNHVYVFYSGSLWKGDRYATGLLDCGVELLNQSKCTRLPVGQDTFMKPYFGKTSGFAPHNAFYPLPEDPGGDAQTSPGAMAAYTGKDGSLRVTWHSLYENFIVTNRRVLNGTLQGPLGQWSAVG